MLKFFTETIGQTRPDPLPQLDIYKHLPLESPSYTRVVELLPAEEASHPLRCKIHHIDLDKPFQTYTAISYAWGDPSIEVRKILDCDGFQALIPPTLHSTLTRLRHESNHSQLFWADAISINQAIDPASLAERSSQVRIMDSIFSKAREVVVDLGEYASDDRSIVQGLQRYATVEDRKWETAENIFRNEKSRRKWRDDENANFTIQDLDLPKLNDSLWPAMQRFLSRPWFRRLWIVQEFALGQSLRILIGHDCVPGHVLQKGVLRAVTHLEYLVSQLPERISLGYAILSTIGFTLGLKPVLNVDHKAAEMNLLWATYAKTIGLIGQARILVIYDAPRDYYGQPYHDMNFYNLFIRFRHFEVSDARDRVYGILGMASDRDAKELYVDYSEPLENLSIRISRYMIDKGFGISLLHNCSGPTSSGPSWSVALTEATNVDPLDTLAYSSIISSPCLFECSKSTDLNIRILPESRHISIRGVLLGPILSQTSVCPLKFGTWDREESFNKQSWVKEVVKWMHDAEMLARFMNIRSRATEDFHTSCWRTIITDMVRDDESRTFVRLGEKPDHVKTLKAIAKISSGDIISSLTDISTVWTEAQGLKRNLFCVIGRRLGLGYTGPCLLPEAAKTSDQLAIFLGCPIPFVIRDAKAGTFRLVGSCYLHGMMDGQVLKNSEWEVQEIVLS